MDLCEIFGRFAFSMTFVGLSYFTSSVGNYSSISCQIVSLCNYT